MPVRSSWLRSYSIHLVNLVSWRYEDPARQLCERLGITPKRAVYGPVGGEGPIRFLHEAALRIQRGESVVGAVCGAEAQSTVNKAEKAGVKLPWTPFAEHGVQSVRSASWQHPLAIALGVFQPITVYPFYDAATAAHWGQTPREALRESSELWSAFSGVAAKNPHAWLKRAFDADAIMTPTADNRLIAWPYNKLMVANPMVNQGAALIITSLAKAREAGIAEDRLIYFVGGASAEEPRDYLVRTQYVESHAQNAVLNSVIDMAGGDGTKFEAIKSQQLLSLRAEDGATHARFRRRRAADRHRRPHLLRRAAQQLYDARRLRDGSPRARGAELGLLYGQGGFVTKHHALVLSPRNGPAEPLSGDRQRAGDRRQKSRRRAEIQSGGRPARQRSKALP